MGYSDDAAVLALLAGFYFVLFIFAIAGYLITAFFLMKVFDKAGVQGKWRAWVPIYNSMVFTKLGDLSPWLVLIGLGATIVLGWIPVLGQIIALIPAAILLAAAWRVGLKLQKEPVWLILAFFLSIVWLGILAFDKSRWNKDIPPAPWAGNNFLADSTVWAGVPVQTSAVAPAAPAAPAYAPPAPPASAPPAPAADAPPAPPAPAAPAADAPAAPRPRPLPKRRRPIRRTPPRLRRDLTQNVTARSPRSSGRGCVVRSPRGTSPGPAVTR
ncbi:DUF5684 domain-containing protein [Microbacterium sp. NIBRBAC000506063]|uniref:DUF5684 domain-containing protein n=1 Tax=Microbacterium sp. NIBRBAC000506063 TaxID=2734618 RepID=UPI001CB72E16|nr:DUF5684 domain-containing protein [Microbacterium sp. NIBRBAC000506063]